MKKLMGFLACFFSRSLCIIALLWSVYEFYQKKMDIHFKHLVYPFALTYVQSPPPSQPVIPSCLPPPRPNATTNITIHPSSKSTVLVVAISVVGAVAVISATFCCGLWVWRRKHKKEALEDHNDGGSSDQRSKPLLISLRTLRSATRSFSDVNKLGEGGFGPVYKGRLSDGNQIAVKSLSRNSCQGIEEMKMEVFLVAKLLHRNLVRLIGFCLEEEKKLLVYKFLPNGSLDQILFEQRRRIGLSWEKHYVIISGVARGMLYLHEDLQLRIIHRDLKASIILLDQDMNPQISDFGLAKLFA